MKKCPFCAEEIQDEAIKCRHCGEMLEKKEPWKWYFKTSTLVLAFLCVGPLALPLAWINPRFSRTVKVVITLIVVVISYILGLAVAQALKSVNSYYQILLQS